MMREHARAESNDWTIGNSRRDESFDDANAIFTDRAISRFADACDQQGIYDKG
jgi:hypothetical protein